MLTLAEVEGCSRARGASWLEGLRGGFSSPSACAGDGEGTRRGDGAVPAPAVVRRRTALRARNRSPWKGSKHFTSFN